MLEDKELEELFAKRKYNIEHPEEAKRKAIKRDDGYGFKVIEPKKQQKKH